MYNESFQDVHLPVPDTSATELAFNRRSVPEKIPGLSDDNESSFVIGIGGHHAPPNVRLFSYVLPAIELAKKDGDGKHSLTLTSSLNAALRYNYANAETAEQNAVSLHTRRKIAFILAFIKEFFPKVFSETGTYYGDIQNEVPEEVWINIWDEIRKIRPDICDAFLKGIRREESNGTKAYAVRHAFWFLDFVIHGDTEFTGNINASAISTGSEKEALFNSIRRGALSLPLDFLEKTLNRTVIRREKIFQLIFPTGNPVPYGEASKGKKGKTRSAEVEISSDQSIVSLEGKLLEDVLYTFDKLEELAGASRKDFLNFLNSLKS